MAAVAEPQTVTTAMTVAQKQAIPPRQAFAAILQKQVEAISQVAASHISPVRLINIAVGAAMRQPLLFECDASTVIRSLLQAAELGLEVGAANEAYLVPFKNNKRINPATGKVYPNGIYECQLLQDYRGILKLVWQSQMIASVDAGVVYKGDVFKYRRGTDLELIHEPNLDRDLPERFWPARLPPENPEDQYGPIDPSVPCRFNEIRCVFAAARTTTGGKVAVVLRRSDVEKFRNMSRAKDSTFWMEHWEAMGGRKTPLRQLCNFLPRSSQLMKAIALDNAVETADFSGLTFEIPEANYEEPGPPAPDANGNGKGMQAAKDSLKQKLEGKDADELALAIKAFKLSAPQQSEVRTKLEAINGAMSYEDFIAQAARDGLKGFAQLLLRLAEMKTADQGNSGLDL